MKKASAELFDLVKSLSKTEKRYFKLYAKRHFPQDNQYLLLFNLIDEQTEYDEKRIAKEFSRNKSLSHFAVVKKQLYENVLDALHRYDEYAHPEQQVRKGIHYCAVLLKKGLFAQCKKQIIKYKALAYKLEKFESIIEIIEIEKRLISRQQFTAHTHAQLEELQKEQNNCLQQIQTANTYWLKSSRIFKMHYEKAIAPGKENTALHELIGEQYFHEPEQATNMRSKLDFLQINALHAFVNADAQKAYTLNAEFLQLLEAKPQFKILYADRYFSVLNNYLIDSLQLQNYDELLNGIKTLRSLTIQTEFKHINNLEANVFRLSYLLEINYFISTKQFAEIINYKNTIEEGLKKHKNKISGPGVITMNYLIAYAFFCNGHFTECLDEINMLLQTKDAETVIDIYMDARMMQLLCHFELHNYQLLESLLISMQRLLTAQNIKQQTYKIILRYLKQYSQKANKPSFISFKKQLQELAADKKEKIAFNNFDYVYWVTEVTK
ncbi:MAG: hypothetical protein H7Y00_09880 [Fimbriimonadaceae bacterium]|nr:hypothetical protein [Chitinophagales bacterium]